MKSLHIAVLSLILVLSSASTSAAIINIQLNSLTFTDGHQVSGFFNYNTIEKKLESLAITLFGDDYNIDFDQNHLVAADAFSVNFDNDIFGDNGDEGFQLFSTDMLLSTGKYGYGDNDTCYDHDNGDFQCTGVLFRMSSSSPIFTAVDTPKPALLLLFGLTLLLGRKYRK
jgi:hypothetical protein